MPKNTKKIPALISAKINGGEVEFKATETCFVEFVDQNVFKRRFVKLNNGRASIPYFGGATHCYVYSVKDVEPGAAPGTQRQPYDVPTP